MKLVLSDGTEFQGTAFGADREVAGEVVFNTGMTGYTEALTDPSYRGQILVLTYPLEGNYGIPDEGWESSRIQVEGLVIGRLAKRPSHPRKRMTLGEWLTKFEVPAITDVDTRALTRILRSAGTMPGRMIGASSKREPINMARVAEIVTESSSHQLGTLTGPQTLRRYDGGHKKVLLIDTGAKESIVRSLQHRDLSVVRVPFFEKWEALLDEVDAIMLPNGPGDPTDLGVLVERLRPLVLNGDKPILGICLGHQLVSLAAGAKTYKLPYGHRSQNQPVMDLETKRTYITSQNHGYAVDATSITNGFVESYRNLNDGTNEGIRHSTRPIMTVQFHPEAASGPHDTEHVFDRFASVIHGRSA